MVDLDVDLNIVFVTAPVGDSPWERLTFTASNPDGQTASATIDVFVNEGPVLSAAIAPIQMEEDGAMDLELDGLVEDPDTPLSQLQWSATSPSGLAVTITGPPYVAHLAPTTNWHGEVQISLVVVDEFGFADTAAVAVSVASVNDAPEMLISPNVRLIRGRRDSSLTLAQLIADADHGLDELELRWTGADKVEIELRGGRLVLSASAVWLGTETIQLEVTDGEGLTANAPLTVTVIQSLPPSIVDPPRRLGLPAGGETIIELQSFVVDPDDPRSALQWRASGQQQLSIQLSSSGAARLVAPVGFSGSEVLHFEVTDPSGEQAFFELMVFAASAGGEPAIAPLPDIEVPLGGVDASLDLDDYVFDLDHEPSRMEWEVPVTEGLELRVDPLSHVLTVTASDSARTGDLDILLRVRDPDGNESSQSLTIRIPAAPGDTTPVDDPEITPILASLPTLTLVEGAFDQSLVLDDYLSGIDPATISWKVEGQQHAEILVDPESRRVTVLAGLDWSGTEIIIFRGEDELGHTVEGMLGLRILPNTVALSLRELTEVSVLAGDRQFELGLAGLLEGDGDAGLLEWEVRANRVYTVAYDAESNSLELTAEAMPLGDEVLTLVARMGDSEELTGVVVVHAHPVDGSFGADSDDLRIAVIPNPLQPDYIDIYVLSDLATRRVPRLRLHDGDWRDLAVTELAVADVAVAGRLPGIWHGRHVLPTHAAGDIRFLALTLEGEEVLKTDYTLIVGLPPSVSSPKAVSADVLTDAVR